MHTELVLSYGNLTRSRPAFKSGKAGAGAVQLQGVGPCRLVLNAESDEDVKNQNLKRVRYIVLERGSGGIGIRATLRSL